MNIIVPSIAAEAAATDIHQDSILPWLDHLNRLFPISHALVIGAGQGSSPWLHFLRTSTKHPVTLVEAEASSIRRLRRTASDLHSWSFLHQLIAPTRGPAVFHHTSISSENSLLSPDMLQDIWPRLSPQGSVQSDAITLGDALYALSSPANWLIIDCFPSLPLLQSCDLRGSAVQVLVARVTSSPDGPHLAGSALEPLTTYLDELGFRFLTFDPGHNPKTGHALFLRMSATAAEDVLTVPETKPAETPPQASSASNALSKSAKQVRMKAHAIRSNLSPNHPQRDLIMRLCTEISILDHELALSLERNQLQGQAESDEPPPASLAELNDRWLQRIRSLAVSQLGQDLWVLERTSYKRGGFFVEFGATNGILLSNSYLLEKEFGWNGICAEPNPHFFSQLRENRLCTLSPECIGPVSGEEVEFVFADVFGGMLRDIDKDEHKAAREAYRDSGATARLVTISLDDFLKKHGAPRTIDYLSIDTEGSEFAILEPFPFDLWDIRHITVEHNKTPQRQMIRELLTAHGYECQEAKWDDWYYKIEQH